MEAIFMSAGAITTIILCLVGIAKLPFDNFKAKHPKWYKAVFTLLSIILTFGACIVNQAFILDSEIIFNIDFAVMLITTLFGVLFVYNGIYEGLGLKELCKRLYSAIKNIKTQAPESKLAKGVAKLEKKAEKLGFNLDASFVKVEQPEPEKTENATTENTINAQN